MRAKASITGETAGNKRLWRCVRALQVVGPILYVGGDFQDGAGIPTADYLLACDLASGAPSATTVDPAHLFSGPVKTLTATSDGTLYAGGRFGNLENIPAADNVAYLPQGGTWHAMGSGGGVCGYALDAYVRGLTANGTDEYVGTEGSNAAGIAQADHVVKWDGSAWSAMGSNTGGADGWFPPATNIYDLTSVDSHVFATRTFQNAERRRARRQHRLVRRHHVAAGRIQRRRRRPVGRRGSALALVDRELYAAGNFTSAGGDTQAQSVASFSLTQIIAYPTPTVTQGPDPLPTPTVTPVRHRLPPRDVTAPATSLGRARIKQATRKATFRFASGEPGSTFFCKPDKRKLTRRTSPKTYKKLAPGGHVFRIRARDRAGNPDATPGGHGFKIKKQ